MERAVQRRRVTSGFALSLLYVAVAALAVATGCASPSYSGPSVSGSAAMPVPAASGTDPRVGLRAGLFDAGEAVWNLRVLSTTPPPEAFLASWNSDLAFSGNYVIQGNFSGFLIWDISDPRRPNLVTAYSCPGSQNDVSVYRHLLFVSVEGPESRLDCGREGIAEAISAVRVRGIRIFDISDVREPKYVGNVQTCRGSHTHTVLVDPKDTDHVYIYVSGVSPPRDPAELAGCSSASPADDPNSALARIDVIRVPLAQPQQARIVSTPRILEGLAAPPRRTSAAPEDSAFIAAARARGEFVVTLDLLAEDMVIPSEMADQILAGFVQQRGGTGAPTAADSAALRAALPAMLAQMFGNDDATTICHDITVYPAAGIAGGACLGYGVLLDISDPVQPRRTAALADSNFIAWHSATFNNDATKVLFTDEWGGGTSPKCRATDPPEWGANAIYSITNGRLELRSYFKMPAAQSITENCVAHNGSLIPIPGRDVMVQGWYQGGVNVFDWTDADNPFEIAFHDRGPVDASRMVTAGSWSAYWHNGLIISSEIARGLDIFELVPSEFLSQNEIDAARSVRFDDLNVQAQPRFVWPPTFALARAYLDQLERSGGLSADRIASVRRDLAGAERASGSAQRDALGSLAASLDAEAAGSTDGAKVRLLVEAVRELAGR